MTDRGRRSVEVTVINHTRASLMVQGASTLGANATWIVGERALPSFVLSPYASVTWGVMTSDPNGAADAVITLTGLGSEPVEILLENRAEAGGKVTVTGNDRIEPHHKTIHTGEDDHSQFEVSLNPAAARKRA